MERTLARLSKWCALFMQYDKHAKNFLGLLHLACALLGLSRRARLIRDQDIFYKVWREAQGSVSSWVTTPTTPQLDYAGRHQARIAIASTSPSSQIWDRLEADVWELYHRAGAA